MRYVFWITLSLFIISASGLGVLYAKRSRLYAKTEIVPASLGELYPVAPKTLAITALTPKPQALEISLSGNPNCTDWAVKVNGKPSLSITGANPTLPLQIGTHDYVLIPRNCEIRSPKIDAVSLNVFFSPKKTFGVQNVSIDQIQLNSANIPVLMEPQRNFSRWVPNVKIHSKSEAQAAKQALMDAGFNPTTSVREKIVFIASFVRNRMPSGTPAERLNTLTPYTVFTEAEAGRARSFCRQWSLAYGYFANVVGIPTRNLFTGGAMGDVDLGSHAFSESYIPTEGRWAYVDPTNDIAYVQNRKGHILSGADVYMAAVSNNIDGMQVRMISTDAEKPLQSFRNVAPGIVPFMHRENFLIYIGSFDGRYQMDAPNISRYAFKLWRFVAQPQQYFGYTLFTSYHWLRALCFYMALVSGGLFTLSMLILIGRKTQQR